MHARKEGCSFLWLGLPFGAAMLLLAACLIWPASYVPTAVASGSPAVPDISQDAVYQSLPFAQDWTNTDLITMTDNWSGVPGIIGYRGDNLTTSIGADPQTILADGSASPVDVNANLSNPDGYTTGGVAEFHLTDPVVALQGSVTADAPFLLLQVNTTGWKDITVSYILRDIDGSADDAVQPVALQYRLGSTGDFTNVPAGYVPDATSGPNLASLVTPVSARLPIETDNQPEVQVRIMTTNAGGSDEWVGIDDIAVTGVSNREFLIAKSAPSMVSPDEIFTYILTITNSTGIVAAGTAITDVLPMNATFVSASDGGILVGDVVSWTVAGPFADGAAIQRSFQVKAPSSAGTSLVNNDYAVHAANWATPTAGLPVTTIVSPVDLLAAQSGPSYGFGGEPIVYRIDLDNRSSVVPATHVILTDTLPLGTTYVSDDSAWGCPACVLGAGGDLNWAVGDLPSNTLHTFNLTVTVDSGIAAGTILTNTLEASTSTPGDNLINNTSKVETLAYPILPIASVREGTNGETYALEGQVTVLPGSYSASEWELQDNSGGISVYYSPAPSLALGDRVRMISSLGSYRNQEQMGKPVYFFNLGPGLEAKPLITTTGSVPSGSTEGWLIQLEGAVSGLNGCSGNYGFGLDDGTGSAEIYIDTDTRIDVCKMDVTNGSQIRLVGFSTQFDNTFEVKPRSSSDVKPLAAKLGISKTAPMLVQPGQLFTYTLTIENLLGYSLDDVWVTDTVPANTTFVSARNGGVESGGILSWNIPSLADRATLDLSFAVTATNAAGVFVYNRDYALSAANYITPTFGAAVVTAVDTAPLSIHHIQGPRHISPFLDHDVTSIQGVVTVLAPMGFYMQEQAPDHNDATSEGIYVYLGAAPAATVGDLVSVDGTVQEYYPGSGGLSITELSSNNANVTVLGADVLPDPLLIGKNGRVPPDKIIEDDANGNVETRGVFDPGQDGIDFYESLEGMLVQVKDAIALGPTNYYGEIAVVGDQGKTASTFTPRGGLVIQPDDFNPERIIIDDVLTSTRAVDTGAFFSGTITGVMDYSFGSFKLLTTGPLPAPTGGVVSDTASLAQTGQLSVGTFNLENLDPNDGPEKFVLLASEIVNNLHSPDILAVEEIQDSSGPTDNGVVTATLTYETLASAVRAAGGPDYDFRDISPVDGEDGGEPGGNIRVGFLFRPDRVAFVDRPGGTSTSAVAVTIGASGVELSFSPGRIDPTDPAFTGSRKPLAGEFMFGSHKVFVVANHFNSKGGDEPLFGSNQPPVLYSEVQRIEQARIVNEFVKSILAMDPHANVIVLGDFNDFQFSKPVTILAGSELTNLISTLPVNERYSYVYDGNSQVLDQILVSQAALDSAEVEIVHVNAEFNTAPSDHDPVLARLSFRRLYLMPYIARNAQ